MTNAIQLADDRSIRVDYSGARSDQQLVQLWLRRYGKSGAPLTETHTQKAYRRDSGLFLGALELQGVSLAGATVRHVLEALEGLGEGVSLETHRRRISSIKSLLAFGHTTGYLRYNVGATIRPPRQLDHLAERILSREQVFLMVAACPEGPQRTLLRFLYFSGARVSEASQVRCGQVHAREGGRVQVTIHGKGGKTRHVLLPPGVSGALTLLLGQPDDYLFRFLTPRAGVAASRAKAAWRLVSHTAVAAGIHGHVSPHWMRHAHASHALDQGAPLHVVQATLGHASPAITGRYLHVRPGASSSEYLER